MIIIRRIIFLYCFICLPVRGTAVAEHALWQYTPPFSVAHCSHLDSDLTVLSSLPFSFGGPPVDFAHFAHEAAMADMDTTISEAPVPLYTSSGAIVGHSILYGPKGAMLQISCYQGAAEKTTVEADKIAIWPKGEDIKPIVFGSRVVEFKRPESKQRIVCTRRDGTIPYMGFLGEIDWKKPDWPFGEHDFSTVNVVMKVFGD